jgi:hypothetical protein
VRQELHLVPLGFIHHLALSRRRLREVGVRQKKTEFAHFRVVIFVEVDDFDGLSEGKVPFRFSNGNFY